MSYIPLNPLLRALLQSTKRRVFVSYHHENDQYWADLFRNIYADTYEIFYDNSLDDEVDSDDYDYIYRKIREDYIKGTSITIVLCGAETWKRRFVDWEIRATLYYEHALLGIILPTAINIQNKYIVPHRLHDNVISGYAYLILWPTNALLLKNGIDTAISRSKQKSLINNSREMMKRNIS